jgi:hypothetical protein
MHADEAPRCGSLHTMMTFIIRSRAMHRDNQAESERLFRKLFERSVGFATLTRAAGTCRPFSFQHRELSHPSNPAPELCRGSFCRRARSGNA